MSYLLFYHYCDIDIVDCELRLFHLSGLASWDRHTADHASNSKGYKHYCDKSVIIPHVILILFIPHL